LLIEDAMVLAEKEKVGEVEEAGRVAARGRDEEAPGAREVEAMEEGATG
jgi:hypothetical protein